MKTKSEQVEIMTKALISRCHGLYSQEALGNEIMDFTERVVKLLTAPQVSKCEEFEREALLLAKFLDWLESVSENSVDREWIQDYFKANNSC